MQIIAHRGAWQEEKDKNTLWSFERAFKQDFGIETDIRDYEGNLVISHNIADSTCPSFEHLLRLYKANKADGLPLALNTKADGIQGKAKKLLNDYEITNYFFFDMSVPEQVVYLREGMHTFTRQSEFEPQPVLYEHSMGVWMDEFEESWITKETIQRHLNNKKKVGIISPEIHGRDNTILWRIIRKINGDIMLCTDQPEKAKEFLNGQD